MQSFMKLARIAAHRYSQYEVLLLTLGVAAAAILVAIFPTASGLLEYRLESIANRQVWRLLTGHLTHWNFDHLLWDTVMFVVLGAMIANCRQWTATILLSALGISAVLWFQLPHVATYRGLSGVDTALFVVVVSNLVQEHWSSNRRIARLALASLTGLTAKLAYETFTGHCLFVDDQAAGFTPLVAAHVVGAISGVAVVAATRIAMHWAAPAKAATAHPGDLTDPQWRA